MISSQKNKILIVEDDDIDARFFEHVVTSAGFKAKIARTSQDALDAFDTETFDLVLADFKMLDIDGIQLLEIIKRYYPGIEVIIITAHASVETAVEAMRKGAYSYFVKGTPTSKLLVEISSAIKQRSFEHSGKNYTHDIESCRLVTRGATFKNVLHRAEQLAENGGNVLLVGVPGTGRAALARRMHAWSKRHQSPLFEIDCADYDDPFAQLTDELNSHITVGTLLIQNIDQIPPDILQELFIAVEKRFPPTEGDNLNRIVYITSTQSTPYELKQWVGNSLFYRYCALQLMLPTLAERNEDIPVVVEAMRQQLNSELETRVEALDHDLLKHLSQTAFIREFAGLEELLKRLLQSQTEGVLKMALFNRIETSDVVFGSGSPIAQGEPSSLLEARSIAEKKHIELVLGRTQGNRTRAAAALGVSSRQLYTLLKKYGIGQD
ncbi:sigma-54-dependent transcriptional regulator [Desulfovibrio inopinatus]|uniref:sigma-54-dependent transcriptional regulator n=1 Tax=Desulfovibrio inopinatus TaxID=102109 RepID=UPI0004217A19|nr:response regulator [Desulfovibrio inopinatus]